MEHPVLLEMRGISKTFPGVKALDNVNLTVRAGTVHALMGENGAGKSTLMKCLFGIYNKDSGDITLDGKPVDFKSSKEALENGVAMVHQELNQALTRTVQDNLWLGRYPKVAGIMGQRAHHGRTHQGDLRHAGGQRQSQGDHVHPAGFPAADGRDRKGRILRFQNHRLRRTHLLPDGDRGGASVPHHWTCSRKRAAAIIYISHKMDEILRISDDVTIMRDGTWVATRPAKELTMDEIIRLMVGRELTNRFPPKTNTPGEVILDVSHISGQVHPS